MRDGFVFYNFSSGEVHCLNKEVIQAKKSMKVVDGFTTSVTMAAAPVMFHGDVSHVNLALIWQDYGAYR